MTKDTDKKSTLDSIVSDAMKGVAQAEYLRLTQLEKDGNCNGNIECLVSRHTDFNKERAMAHSLAMTFNSYADYERAIRSLQTEQDSIDQDKDGMISNLLDFANAPDADTADNAIHAIMRPFSITSRRDTLQRMATAYACLTLEWDKGQSWYGWFSAEKCTKRTMIGNHIAQALTVMQSKGTLEEWRRLTKELAPSDDRLKILERNLHP